MIDARDIAKALKLSAPDEAEVQRLGMEIVTAVKKPDYDGRPFNILIPAGTNSEQYARTDRIVRAIQRRFQEKGWICQLDTTQDAYGQPEQHSLWFVIDPAAMRLPSPANSPVETKPSLRWLYEELDTIYGTGGARIASQKPEISILLGTYNRLPLLRLAIESIRVSVGALEYEVVVVDGGSTDGSRAWLANQPDVILVGDRHLRGAVDAFNVAFKICRGKYVANANDDIKYERGVLAEGVFYLAAHPEVGQVAFALRGEGEDFVVNEIHPGKVYANHGIIRKSIADQIAHITGGYWPPIYHTYAGDCELSAWVAKLGHKVVALPHLRVLDSRPNDVLREKNQARFGADTKKMYTRWPASAFQPDGLDPRVTPGEIARFREVIGAKASNNDVVASSSTDALETMVELVGLPWPEEERRLRKLAPRLRELDPVDTFPKRADRLSSERVLHIHINGVNAVDQQEGLVRALKEFGEYEMVRWTDYPFELRQEKILEAAGRLKPTLVFAQLQTPGVVDVETVRKLREISPKVVIATWCGDIAESNSMWNVDQYVEFGRCVDLVFSSSMTHVLASRAAGCHNYCYLQIGFDELQYSEVNER